MYIKSIALEGFKSFRDRVDIIGLHPKINIITGPPGSGKSSILEAICFLVNANGYISQDRMLYFDNIERAKTAIVSVTFDNTRKETSPYILRMCDEVTMTKHITTRLKTKFFINDKQVDKAVFTLVFEQINLSVDNPTFVIPQYRITEVADMTPPELTKMIVNVLEVEQYTNRTQEVLSSIREKEEFMSGLCEIINDLVPKIRNMQMEHPLYNCYKDVTIACTSLNRLYVAWKYSELDYTVQSTRESIRVVRNEMKKEKREIKSIETVEKDYVLHLNRMKKNFEAEHVACNEIYSDDLKDFVREYSVMLCNVLKEQKRIIEWLVRYEFHLPPCDLNLDDVNVLGPMFQLFQATETVYCVALEAVAGTMLFNVLVDNSKSRNLLLKRGHIRNHVTVVAIDKVHSQVMDKRTQHYAKLIGKGEGNVQLAIDLVNFDAKLRPIMVRAFGNTFICRNGEVAKKIATHPRIKKRCVTLDGEVFEPSGESYRGWPTEGCSVLVNLEKLKNLNKSAFIVKRELNEARKTIGILEYVAYKNELIGPRKDMVPKKLEVVVNDLVGSFYDLFRSKIRALRDQVTHLSSAVAADSLEQRGEKIRMGYMQSKHKKTLYEDETIISHLYLL